MTFQFQGNFQGTAQPAPEQQAPVQVIVNQTGGFGAPLVRRFAPGVTVVQIRAQINAETPGAIGADFMAFLENGNRLDDASITTAGQIIHLRRSAGTKAA